MKPNDRIGWDVAKPGSDRTTLQVQHPRWVSDGFGNTWPPCSTCGHALQVVRPGKAQCVHCEAQS